MRAWVAVLFLITVACSDAAPTAAPADTASANPTNDAALPSGVEFSVELEI